jgi:adenylate cyclase
MTQIVKESQRRIKKALAEGFEYDHIVIAKSDQFLRTHVSQKLDFAVMYIDMVGSTRMSTKLAPDFLSRIVTVFSQEVSYAIEHCQGLVLKFNGDAVISYFPPSSSALNDLNRVILCGEATFYVIKHAINPLLLQMGHDGIDAKITSDFGQHTILRYGSDYNRSHVDIISATMNLAAKMQSVARGGQMIIGEKLYDKLDDDTKTKFAKAVLDKNRWNFHDLAEQKSYQLYWRSL